jgi:hypothetical protein
VLSLRAYLAGYVGRFQIMSKVAKTGVREVDHRCTAVLIQQAVRRRLAEQFS